MRWTPALLLLAGCSDLPPFFDSGVERVVFEVDYAPGAEPAVGTHGEIDDVWNIAAASTRALLGDDKEYVFPRKLEDMGGIASGVGREVTKEDVLAISAAHRDEHDSCDTLTVHLVWLDAVYVIDGARREGVMAVSLDDTRVIGVFKPALSTAAAGVPEDKWGLVEQTIVVHELGHAYGFVDRGVPRLPPDNPNLLTSYEDRSLQANHHCFNGACVMAAGAATSHVESIESGELVLFGEECLADARDARD